jgi:hypothetical protein
MTLVLLAVYVASHRSLEETIKYINSGPRQDRHDDIRVRPSKAVSVAGALKGDSLDA